MSYYINLHHITLFEFSDLVITILIVKINARYVLEKTKWQKS